LIYSDELLGLFVMSGLEVVKKQTEFSVRNCICRHPCSFPGP